MVRVPVMARGRSILSARGEGQLRSPGVWPALRAGRAPLRCHLEGSDGSGRSFDSLRSLRMTEFGGIQVVPRY